MRQSLIILAALAAVPLTGTWSSIAAAKPPEVPIAQAGDCRVPLFPLREEFPEMPPAPVEKNQAGPASPRTDLPTCQEFSTWLRGVLLPLREHFELLVPATHH